jgi:hypothetical protein
MLAWYKSLSLWNEDYIHPQEFNRSVNVHNLPVIAEAPTSCTLEVRRPVVHSVKPRVANEVGDTFEGCMPVKGILLGSIIEIKTY